MCHRGRRIVHAGSPIQYTITSLAGAFFDWLPLPTGWMRVSGGGRDRRLALTHAAITLVAYCLASLWIIFSLTSVPVGFSQVLRLAFIEVWWLAVMVGVTLVS